MSDHITCFIPTDPRFVPSKQAQRAAIALLRELAPVAEDVASEVDEAIVFRDCGENFDRVSCPHCRAGIAIDTWQDWMSEDFSEGDGFQLATIVVPCCGATSTLNDLVYDWAQGFSRYALRATNVTANVWGDAKQKLEAALGCKLRVIRQMI